MATLTVELTVDGLAQHAWVQMPTSPRALVVLCHGMPSGSPPAPGDEGYPGLARRFAVDWWASAWFNFRGCRDAPGNFSPQGWVNDLCGVLDALHAHPLLGQLRTAVVGSSLGGATAIAACAGRTDVDAVATLAAPAVSDELIPSAADFLDQAREVGIVRDPGFPPDPTAWAQELSALAPERIIGSIAPRPVLLVHGELDPTVPALHGERLFEAARSPKELARIPQGGHQLRRDPRAVDAVLDWLERWFGGDTPASHQDVPGEARQVTPPSGR